MRANGTRQLLAFTRSTGESQAAREGLLQELYRQGLEGRHLKLIVTDGCLGRWRDPYPQLVTRLLQDLPELLAFFQCPRPLWRTLRTTNVIERCFVEVRWRPRPLVCFVNVQSVERITFSIVNQFNLEWRQRILRQFT